MEGGREGGRERRREVQHCKAMFQTMYNHV